MWIVIHKCMEATLVISPYSYLYPKLAKSNVFPVISYVFSSTKSKKRVDRFCLEAGQGGGGEWGAGGTNNVYTH
jgi:hypothetical protein